MEGQLAPVAGPIELQPVKSVTLRIPLEPLASK